MDNVYDRRKVPSFILQHPLKSSVGVHTRIYLLQAEIINREQNSFLPIKVYKPDTSP